MTLLRKARKKPQLFQLKPSPENVGRAKLPGLEKIEIQGAGFKNGECNYHSFS